MNLRSTIEDNYNKVYWLLTCPHCGEVEDITNYYNW